MSVNLKKEKVSFRRVAGFVNFVLLTTFFLVLVFIINHKAGAVASLVQITGTTQAGASSISTSINSSSAGNVIIACIQTSAQLSTGVTDNQSNTYTLATRSNHSGSEVSIYYAYNITGGVTSVTSTFAGWSTVSRIVVAEYSGLMVTDPLDKTANYDNGWNGGSSFYKW